MKIKALNFALTLGLSAFSTLTFSQNIQDLGVKTYEEVKAMNDVAPCELTPSDFLSYCVEGGNKINYLFENNKLSGIMYATAYLTKQQAEQGLIEEVNKFSVKTKMNPVYTNGMALFYLENSPLTSSFGVSDFKGTTYLVYYTFLSK